MTSEPDKCHHVYSGGTDGGVRGARCKHPESEHCPETHQIVESCEHPNGWVHHAFKREPMSGLFQMTLKNVTCGLVVVDSIVTEAAPVAKWAIGQPLGAVQVWARKKGGNVRRAKA